jgi:hypothetical protein
VTEIPEGLGAGGSALWTAITTENHLDAAQQAQLVEACRAKDRLDKLDSVLRGDADVWLKLTHSLRTEDYELKVDAALSQANATANLMKQLLAALRLPDAATGKRPQYRGARGAQAPSVPGGKVGTVTALDKLRQAAGG